MIFKSETYCKHHQSSSSRPTPKTKSILQNQPLKYVRISEKDSSEFWTFLRVPPLPPTPQHTHFFFHWLSFSRNLMSQWPLCLWLHPFVSAIKTSPSIFNLRNQHPPSVLFYKTPRQDSPCGGPLSTHQRKKRRKKKHGRERSVFVAALSTLNFSDKGSIICSFLSTSRQNFVWMGMSAFEFCILRLNHWILKFY